MMTTLPNSTSLLASGKAGTLAVTVLAADRVTVLVPRSFGTLTEIGTTAIYWGPPLSVDAAASGFIRYDTDGDARTVGVVVDLQPFYEATNGGVSARSFATAVWETAPAGTPLEALAAAVRDVSNMSPAPGSLGAAVAAIKADTSSIKHKMDNLPTSPAAGGSNILDGIPSPPASSASFLGSDTATKGDWTGTYGADGYVLPDVASAAPSYAAIIPSGHASWTWAASTDDPRALRKPGVSGDRTAATWYDAAGFTVDVTLADSQARRLTLYMIDWDYGGERRQQVELLDAATDAVLDGRTLGDFQGGVYLSWTVTGGVRVRLTNLGRPNAVLSGLFLDGIP